jgi:chaperonin GroEL
MQPPKDKIKEVTFRDEAHIKVAEGVSTMREAVGSTYGPGGRNVLIKKQYVQPILTRDGVTVARDIAGHGNRLMHPIASTAAQLVYQASEKTNKTAGDGTTVTVVELAALYTEGRRLIAAGEDAMKIKRTLDRSRDLIVEFIKSKSQTCDEAMLRRVAEVSSGDPALAAMLSDLVWKTGADGSITIAYHNAPTVEIEEVTGYMLPQGFRHLAHEIEFVDPYIFVTQKRMTSKADIIPILELVAGKNRQLVIVGDVTGQAFETMMWALQNQKVDGVVVPPVAYGQDGHDYFEDLAIYTGAHLWLESDAFTDVKEEHFGNVRGARISRDKAVLYGDNSTGDAIAERIANIHKQAEATDITAALKETFDMRAARLAGKASIIKVGAATEVEREELFFRVEDAVEACKSALEQGVVAGGATTLLFASADKGADHIVDLEPFVRQALQQPFELLMSNAGENGGYRMEQVLRAGYGQGFNLREMTEKPVDLYKSGILDATKVILQAVKNSFSVAGALLTTGTIITEHEEAESAGSPVQG